MPAKPPAAGAAHARPTLAQRYAQVRSRTHKLVRPLETEDFVVQSMPDASPAKWHIAHTTWFFEQFLLMQGAKDYRPLDTTYNYLFNSYYNAMGERHPRPIRGLLTRPTVPEVLAYRQHVDEHMTELLESRSISPQTASIVEIGLNHEQQHQELLLTDIKHLLSLNPLRPIYNEDIEIPASADSPLGWVAFDEAVRPVGRAGPGFAYDNESPRHRVLVEAFEIADRLVTNAEYLEFMNADSYTKPELWLDDGWAAVQREGWNSPMYWTREKHGWSRFTLAGQRELDPHAPVSHVSFFEADAFARWKGLRLPTEEEWEIACNTLPIEGNFVEESILDPLGPGDATGVRQAFGDLWEWTASQYRPYPGYQPPAGALGEYNGKFMCNQFVLRGGSCVTPRDHVRPTYRNFFQPEKRWQFSGIRLARESS